MGNTDDILNREDEEVLTFSFGFLFPPNMRYLGYGVLVIGFVSAIETLWSLPITGLIGSWLSFRKSGVQINPRKRTRREYTSFLIKRGKWSSYEDYPYMAVLKGREGYAAYSRAMVEQKITEEVFDIYLLTKDHRKRLIVGRGKDRNDAVVKGQRLARAIGLEWTAYSPKVSDKTRSRIR